MKRYANMMYFVVFSIICIPSASYSQSPKLVFSTLLGGSGGDGVSNKIVVDKHKHIYLMGITRSIDFPFTPGAYDSTFSSSETMFVTKFHPSGSSIIYSTFLAGSGREKPTGLQVDDEGNAFVVGRTGSPGYPRTPGSYFSDVYFNPQELCDRIFLTKINSSGSALVYSIAFGDSVQNVECGYLGLDGEGHAYVMGYANYWDIETTPGTLQEQPPEATGAFSRPFICKFSKDGSGIEYATYFGGPTRGPRVDCFTVDQKGNTYLAGGYASGDFPITENCYSSNPVIPPAFHFFRKIDPFGSQLIYSTFLALSSQGIAVDDSENVYIGYNSQHFPVTPGAYNTDVSQMYGFCKFEPEGNRLVFSTRTFGFGYPFPGYDVAMSGIGFDSVGRVYLVGNSRGRVPLPVTPDAYDGSYNGGTNDIFFCIFDAAGSKLLYATYLGGSGNDVCTDFTVIGSGEVYLTGHTTSPDFPTTEGAYSRTRKGESDAFICKFSFSPGSVKVEDAPQAFQLSPARPNPFNPRTTISFSLPAPGHASLAVYDITGRKVRTLVSGPMSAGAHSVIWDGRDDAGKPAASGVYISRIAAGERVAAGKMVLLK